MTNDCKRYSNGSCIDGDHVSKCVGKDCCGAYEPKSFHNKNSSLRKPKEQCMYYRNGCMCGMYLQEVPCDPNCRLLSANEDDMYLSVAKLREILEEMAMDCNEYRPEPTIAVKVEDIIERVKKEI